jgi:hypothetical protein
MNLDKVITELRAEVASLDKAIGVLEGLSGGHPQRAARKRKPFSAAARKRTALAQRKRWAAERKNQLRLQPVEPLSALRRLG